MLFEKLQNVSASTQIKPFFNTFKKKGRCEGYHGNFEIENWEYGEATNGQKKVIVLTEPSVVGNDEKALE